ncbi:hypothetical protein JVT61DRAFT_14736 [Boletus reticuloceps]|uniref:Uncharacterized protein n=1 Tax=Boletus reticuloceps TaxID=495285 RepID=A0A8I3AC14_9AGAM|nr:hypothetical protein JVT61DRAFT_14736 [Boletus reticuloceps]
MSLIENGIYRIRNGEFPRFVADLVNGVPHGPISAHTEESDNVNDQWRVINVGDGGNQIMLENMAAPGSFALSAQFPDNNLFGSHVQMEWTVVKADYGYYLQTPNGQCVWELPEGADYVQIMVALHTAKNNTKWTFDKV